MNYSRVNVLGNLPRCHPTLKSCEKCDVKEPLTSEGQAQRSVSHQPKQSQDTGDESEPVFTFTNVSQPQ